MEKEDLRRASILIKNKLAKEEEKKDLYQQQIK
jgi:hypothetical protein